MKASGGGLASRVPPGSLPVLAGVVTASLSAYGALAIAARSLPKAAVPSLTTFWALCFLVGPAVFIPLEQVLGSEAARRRSAGQPLAGLLRSGLETVAALAAMLALVVLLAYSFVLRELLDGNRALLLALLLGVSGYAVQHLSRAALLGAGRFRRYAAVIALDGLVRLLGCAALAASGSRSPGWYAGVIALAPMLATTPGLRAWSAWTGSGRSPVLRSAGFLLAGSLASQLLVNLGALVVKASAPPLPPLSASAYVVNASLAQAPLLLGQALLSPLLAELSQAAGSRNRARYIEALRHIVLTVLALGAVAILLIAVAAPPVVRTVFGDDFVLPRSYVLGLGVAGLTFLLAHTLTQAAVAVAANRLPVMAWASGIAAFLVLVAVTPRTVGWVVVSAVCGGLVAASSLAAGLLAGVLHSPASGVSRAW